ncbi:mitochondrial 54s ribosomal protein rml2 [Ceraceosorus bombacis]|uniref:Large ribosomal subunit protein uL2m n=1 Tax=Ceraceosorus bombacis TaxID=401625 RepID=A0A0P1BG84_9BASI|nr:mitochondrial 54s ribosomal protein rml2 [Ceraceosorus bombacis]
MSPAAVAAATRATDRPYRKERRLAQKAQRKQAKRDKAANTIFAKAGVATNKYSAYVRKDQQFKTFKPLTPSLRWVRHLLQPDLHKGKPERALTIAKRSTAGRNNSGKVVVRGRGGGHKRRIRIVDFHRKTPGEQDVLRIEYDPGRSAHIALIEHKESKLKSYILAPQGLRAGDTVESFRYSTDVPGEASGSSTLDIGIFRTRAIRPGNVLQLHLIPIGTMIHNLSLTPHGSAKLIRSAGAVGQLIAFVKRSKSSPVSSAIGQPRGDIHNAFDAEEVEQDGPQQNVPTHAQVKLQSGEVRLVPIRCHATVGRVSNIDHEHVRLGKAGRSRWLGIRPKHRSSPWWWSRKVKVKYASEIDLRLEDGRTYAQAGHQNWEQDGHSRETEAEWQASRQGCSGSLDQVGLQAGPFSREILEPEANSCHHAQWFEIAFAIDTRPYRPRS